jgi:hypothetical protein
MGHNLPFQGAGSSVIFNFVLPARTCRSPVNLKAAGMPTAGLHCNIINLRLAGGHCASAFDAHVCFVQICRREDIMKRHTTFMLIGMVLLGLAIGVFPEVGFAQSSPLIGTWRLNLDKSKFSPGPSPKFSPGPSPPPRSLTLTYTQDGQNIRNTTQLIDAQGNSSSTVFLHIYDGQPHPTTGSPYYDASAYLRVGANTVIFSRSKAGKLVEIGTGVVSQDGKTFTVTTTDEEGTDVQVYDKQ